MRTPCKFIFYKHLSKIIDALKYGQRVGGSPPPPYVEILRISLVIKKTSKVVLKICFSLFFSVKTNVDGYLMPVSSLFTKMSMLAVDLSIFRIKIHMYTDSYDNYFDLKKKTILILKDMKTNIPKFSMQVTFKKFKFNFMLFVHISVTYPSHQQHLLFC